MKKVLIYIFVLLCVLFLMPSIFTRKRTTTIAKENEENEIKEDNAETEIIPYDYSKHATIKLYHSKTEQIEELPIDEYLYGVVSGEMPASYEMEALKAQAVVARTYTLYQIINSSRKTWRRRNL